MKNLGKISIEGNQLSRRHLGEIVIHQDANVCEQGDEVRYIICFN